MTTAKLTCMQCHTGYGVSATTRLCPTCTTTSTSTRDDHGYQPPTLGTALSQCFAERDRSEDEAAMALTGRYQGSEFADGEQIDGYPPPKRVGLLRQTWRAFMLPLTQDIEHACAQYRYDRSDPRHRSQRVSQTSVAGATGSAAATMISPTS